MYIIEKVVQVLTVDDYNLCNDPDIGHLFAILKEILKIIRYVVPIGLAILTTIGIFKKTINPDDKDGQRKIITRIIAAILVYFTPLLVSLVMKVVDIGLGKDHDGGGDCQGLWEKAQLKGETNNYVYTEL